ncbi:hypothetical protein [Candidatus Palauibacter sp.]|uniref:hypothetical protein n=1 Tax=Candidatus Palauibacter sp. TaxID=3101350 RepID=UPI003D14D6FB
MKKISLLAAICLLAACRPPGPTVVGDALPVDVATDRPTVVWAFNADRCLSCTLTDPSRVLRGIQHRHGNAVDFVVVAITEDRERDEALVAAFLRSVRLSARVELQGAMAFTLTFGLGGPEPAVYVADAGRVAAVYGEDLEGLPDDVARLLAD